tara:strand:+ start:2003 stop:2674 length:672 start_codon:yes stop_codon:yes gene_type:complete
MPTVRIIILNYKRPDNVLHIVKAFEGYYPITIINNNPDDSIRLPGIDLKSGKDYKTIDIINNKSNLKCMDRWYKCYQYPEDFKLVLDDDILPSKTLVDKMISSNEPILGIYGKSNVDKAKNYQELNDHWCENAKVDFLVGSVILIKQSVLNIIKEDLFKFDYPVRGDDIIISYLIKKYMNTSFLKTIAGKVLSLPEGDVGLNKDPEHFSMRWNVVKKFKNLTW